MNSRETFTFYMCTLGNWCYSKWTRISFITRNIFFIKKQVQNNICSTLPFALRREWIFKCVFSWLHIKYIWKSLQIRIVLAAGGKGTGCWERDSALGFFFKPWDELALKKKKKVTENEGEKRNTGHGGGSRKGTSPGFPSQLKAFWLALDSGVLLSAPRGSVFDTADRT